MDFWHLWVTKCQCKRADIYLYKVHHSKCCMNLFLEVGGVCRVDLIEEALGMARHHVGHEASL